VVGLVVVEVGLVVVEVGTVVVEVGTVVVLVGTVVVEVGTVVVLVGTVVVEVGTVVVGGIGITGGWVHATANTPVTAITEAPMSLFNRAICSTPPRLRSLPIGHGHNGEKGSARCEQRRQRTSSGFGISAILKGG
jgi:hypothetical protein